MHNLNQDMFLNASNVLKTVRIIHENKHVHEHETEMSW